MLTPTETRSFTPEFLMDIPWEVTNQEGLKELQGIATGFGLKLFEKPKAIRGGKIFGIPNKTLGIKRPEGQKTLEEYLSGERDIGIFPAFEGKTPEPNRLIFLTTQEKAKKFGANLLAWKEFYADVIEDKWKKDGKEGSSPIPKALKTLQLSDGRFAVVTEFFHNFTDLGLGEPDVGVHQMDTDKLKLAEIPQLFNALESISIPSEEFLTAVKQEDIPESQLKVGDAKCAQRGHEWWWDPNAGDDRFRELNRLANGEIKDYRPEDTLQIEALYKNLFEDGDFPDLLVTMITNNLDLYPHQDGSFSGKDPKLLGKMVVTHGTLYPGQIHKKNDSETGEIVYMITGGDRSQLYGLRGQTIDWLVASAAASPDHQKALIKEFIKRYPDEKERRGLAMHVMYRCISEVPWFVKNGKIEEAKNLVKLTHDILIGDGSDWEGAWNGVNTSMVKQR